MLQFLAMTRASCRRLFPRHLRHRITTLSTLALLVAFVQTICVTAVAAESRHSPNIILIMADDQGWGDVGYNGNTIIKTPVLDEMSRTGLRFDRFYAAAPVCSPTRGSVMTGRHPNRFGCFQWGYTLRPQERTLPQLVSRADYQSGHFGKWHLGSCRADSPTSPGAAGFDHWVSAPNFYENNPLMSFNGNVKQLHGESSIVTVEAALDFIRDVPKDEQFLVVIWFGSPHGPHIASKEDLALYPDQTKAQANYLGEITGIDRAMGLLRSELRKQKIADNTLVWYTSDNGPQGPKGRNRPGSAGDLRDRKGTIWEGGIRVPTIIEWPAVIKQPRTTEVPGNTFDIYPTIADLLDLELPGDQPVLDGTSLLPLIEGKPFERAKPMGFWDYAIRGIPRKAHDMLALQKKEQEQNLPPSEEPNTDGKINKTYPLDEFPGHAAWMDGPWKLHQIPAKKNAAAGPFRYELYNLGEDRAETTDLAKEHPDRVKAMTDALQKWQKSVVSSLNGEDY